MKPLFLFLALAAALSGCASETPTYQPEPPISAPKKAIRAVPPKPPLQDRLSDILKKTE